MRRPEESVLAALVDLVLPVECAGCGRPRAPVCHGCGTRLLAELALAGRPAWHLPVPVPGGFPQTAAGGIHQGLLARLVVAFKDEERVDLGEVLASILAGAVALASASAPVALVPVPSSRSAVRRRGRRPTHELAHGAAVILGPGVHVVSCLGQVRRPRDQAGLDRDARLRNLVGTMTLRRDAGPAQSVVIVDDVVTSGATLTEAARALEPLGLPISAAVVGARRRGVAQRPQRVDGR